MKNLGVINLMDLYGNLLTLKQKEILHQYYELDYSLSEIAQNCEISRQAVHFAIRQAEEALFSYEEKLGLCKKGADRELKLKEAVRLIESGDTAAAITELKDLINEE